ncbi:alpha/beta hydrolase [Sphingomonas sp. UYP23]
MLAEPAEAGREIAPAAAIQAEAVRIESEPGVVLAGELHVPPSTEPHRPAVLLLGGGGASPHGIYPLLEARLHAKGIATLSFDKRGVGKSTGTFVDAMTPAERDARAALAYLRSRRDVIDANRIAILGLSQGAVIAPALAVETPAVAAVVLLAAPAGTRGVMFLDAMRVKLAAAGMAPKAVTQVVDATHGYLDALTTAASPATIASGRAEVVRAFVAGGWKPEQAEGAVSTLADPATSSLYTVAASDVLARVRAPVLALYAADDTVVSTALSLPEARLALRANGDATIVEMPDVEHGFKPLVSTTSGQKDYRGWPISDPATLDLISAWLPQRLLRPAATQ